MDSTFISSIINLNLFIIDLFNILNFIFNGNFLIFLNNKIKNIIIFEYLKCKTLTFTLVIILYTIYISYLKILIKIVNV